MFVFPFMPPWGRKKEWQDVTSTRAYVREFLPRVPSATPEQDLSPAPSVGHGRRTGYLYCGLVHLLLDVVGLGSSAHLPVRVDRALGV